MRRRDDLRVIRKSQVIVGAQIEHMIGSAVESHIDSGLLRSRDESFGLEETLGAEPLCLLGKRGQERVWHGVALEL